MTLYIRHTTDTGVRAGFSLIELLVVIVIISVVIAITIPAIGGARDLARGTATQQTMTNLANSVSSFRADEQRLPGYFNAADMNDTMSTNGLTGMQNVLLDLAGGPTGDADPGSTDDAFLTIDPGTGEEVVVNLNLVGAQESGLGGYFQPEGTDYIAPEGKVAPDADVAQLPELLDAWGQPILGWVEDEFAPEVPEEGATIENFAQVTYAGMGDAVSRFSWQQNAGVLSSPGLGSLQDNQTEDSLLGSSETPENLELHLAALLGSPADPVDPSGDLDGANVQDLIPGSSKGGIVFHSAGRDRIYLSRDDKGLRQLGGSFIYGRYFSPTDSALGENPWSDADGDQGQIDIIDEFDDIVVNVAG